MEVRPGYKQTEVGIIPEEWKVTALGDICEFENGDRSSNYPSGNDFTTSGIPFVNAGHVADGKISFSAMDYITPESFARLTRGKIKSGDILYCLRGSLGKYGVAVDGFGEGAIASSLVIVRPRKTSIRLQYLLCYFGSSLCAKMIETWAGGAAQPNLGVQDLARFSMALPNTAEEQRAIAAVLSDMDNLLAKLDQLIAKKRDLKQAAMQQLVTGKTRLPGFSGEWEVKTLFDLAERKKELFDDGDWIESEHITTEGIRLIQTGNIGVGCFVEKETRKFIYEKSFTLLRCKQLKTGDLLVCRLADPAGRACVLPDIGEKRIVTSVDVTIFRPPVGMADRVYLANVFSTPEWFRAVSDRSGGTTHKRISRGALGRISITLPPLPEQTAIATILSDMDAELSALVVRRDKTRDLKQAMMQELLTGRTRLI